MRERPGFVKVPHALLAEAVEHLTPMQERVVLRLLADAAWEASVVRVRGRAVALEAGEVLTGTRNLAERLGVTRDLIRRALERLEGLGWIERRPAWKGPPAPGGAAPQPAPTPAPQATPQPAPRAAPPPSVVKFLRHREILWPDAEARPSGRPSPRPSPRAEPARNPPRFKTKTLDQDQDGEASSPAARTAARREGERAPDPRHAALTDRLASTFAEVRGGPYGHGGGRDGRAVALLLRLAAGDLAEVDRRWRRALALARWPGCATFAALASRWNDLAEPGEGVLGVAPAERHVEGLFDPRTMRPVAGGGR